MNVNQLHAGLPVGRAGAPIATARAAMIMLHGRGAMAADILFLANELDVRQVAVLAPQAANSTWYPNRFIAPVATNEPWLTSALQVVDSLVQELAASGLGAERVFLLGFSQGGCLALEYAARYPRRYAGVIGLSSGLIENGDQPRAYSRFAGRFARVIGLQRRGFPHPRGARRPHGQRAGGPGRGGGQAHLSRHGPHDQPRRDQRHQRADCPGHDGVIESSQQGGANAIALSGHGPVHRTE
jgi:pimeloyl-ACP methyl ester carboxylesterase